MPATRAEPKQLTTRQAEIFGWFYRSTRDNGWQPSLSELAAAVGLQSRTSALNALQGIAAKGWLELGVSSGVSRARAVKILFRPDATPFRGFSDKPSEG